MGTETDCVLENKVLKRSFISENGLSYKKQEIYPVSVGRIFYCVLQETY
jgi:hypothetical protein